MVCRFKLCTAICMWHCVHPYCVRECGTKNSIANVGSIQYPLTDVDGRFVSCRWAMFCSSKCLVCASWFEYIRVSRDSRHAGL